MNELKITNLGNNSNKVYHIWATNMFKILGTKGLTYLGPLGYNSQNWMDNLPAGTQIPALPSKPARPESTNKLGIALFSQESKMWEQRCQDEMDIRNLLEPSLKDVVTMEPALQCQHGSYYSSCKKQTLQAPGKRHSRSG